MDEVAASWSTRREMISVVLTPRQLRRTLLVALIVGSVFFAMNQLTVVASGRATTVVWLKAALTYLTPLVVSNIGVLSATRRRGEPPSPAPGRRLPIAPRGRDLDEPELMS